MEIFRTSLLFLSLAIFLACGPSEEETAIWNNAVSRAKTVNQFDTTDMAINKMGSKPTRRDERGLSSFDPNADTQTFLIWEYSNDKRIFMGFYNDLSSEVKVDKTTYYRASLNSGDIDPRYKK